jgi:hypothetical protein
MSWLFDSIAELLVNSIMSTLESVFGGISGVVNEAALEVGVTPGNWHPGVFSMVESLSNTVILPIAGIVLTGIVGYELIHLIIERNNMSDFESFIFIKWIFKTIIAVLILSNAWTIVMAVFDLASHVVAESAGIITGGIPETGGMLANAQEQLEAMTLGELLPVFLQVQIVSLLMNIVGILIPIVIWGRMIEIYLTVSVAPIPLATMVNREWGTVGNNYLKSLLALGFQGFLIMVCVAIYGALIAAIGTSDNLSAALWQQLGTSILLVLMLFKTGQMAKGIFNAH